MRRSLILCLPLAAAACALPPDSVTKEDLEYYNAALASISCDLRVDADYVALEFQTGLTREQLLEITEYKLKTEEVVPHPEGGYRLNTGPCETNAETPAS